MSKDGGSFWDLFKDPDAGKPKKGSVLNLFAKDGVEKNPEEPPRISQPLQLTKMFWAMQELPVEEALKHFLICGATGSGKTIAIQLLLQSITDRFRAGQPEQLIVFDAKCDVIPLLASLGFHPDDENVHILNPYDRRSDYWRLGEATQMPVMARAFAALMIPDEKNTTAPFFADASRELVYAVILALNEIAGNQWSFRDLLCALDSSDHIDRVTCRCKAASRITARILNDKQHCSSVLSTLATKVGRFEQVAALWEANAQARPFSIEKFLSKPGVLVLGNDPVLRESFWPINAILLKALTNEILRRSNTFAPRHWFILDEFRAMERVDCIHDLLNRGRSKGASVLLGIQSIEGLLQVYGDAGANDILSQCANKTFLRAGSPGTAQWAEKHFGTVRQMERSTSHSSGFEVTTDGWNESLQERAMFLASYFLNLPFPTRGGTYRAVSDVPCLGDTLITHRDFDEVLAQCKQPREDVPAVEPMSDAGVQALLPWDEEEEEKFCAPPRDDSGPDLNPRHNLHNN